jgi:hypothetical protein
MGNNINQSKIYKYTDSNTYNIPIILIEILTIMYFTNK